jgi:hypothetical protein
LVGKPLWKWPNERLSCNWKNNINIHYKDTSFDNVKWIYIAQISVQWSVSDVESFSSSSGEVVTWVSLIWALITLHQSMNMFFS